MDVEKLLSLPIEPVGKGGKSVPLWTRRIGSQGYITVKVGKNFHLAREDQKDNAWMQEAHLVLALEQDCPVAKDVVVHHRNGIRSDDRPENLEVFKSTHTYGANHLDGSVQPHCSTCTCHIRGRWSK